MNGMDRYWNGIDRYRSSIVLVDYLPLLWNRTASNERNEIRTGTVSAQKDRNGKRTGTVSAQKQIPPQLMVYMDAMGAE